MTSFHFTMDLPTPTIRTFMDDNGRVYLNKDIRHAMDLFPGVQFEIQTTPDTITLKIIKPKEK